MTWAGATWLAFRGGRSDRLRIVLTVASTALAAVLVLLAGAVATPPGSEPSFYSNPTLWNEEGLRGGTVFALALLCLPFLAFAAQCSRIGAPERQRRLEDLARLGTTPHELRRVVALEAGIAAAGGAGLGIPLYVLLALVVDSIGAPVPITPDLEFAPTSTQWMADALLLPTDRVPAWWVVLPGLLLLPLLVTVAASVGAARRDRRGDAPRATRRRVLRSGAAVVLALLVASVAPTVVAGASRGSTIAFSALLLLAVVAFSVGAAGLAGELAVAVGGRLAVASGRADLLLAGRRMTAQQRRGASRLTLLLGCLIGGGALVLRAEALAMSAQQGDTDGFFGQTYTLVLVALGLATAASALGLLVAEVEGVVERRRSLATAVAAGVPRAVIARAVVVEAVLPVVPAVLVTTLVGGLVAKTYLLSVAEPYADFPTGTVLGFVGVVCVVATAAAALATLALPASTDVSEARVPA
ncbi:FtsX-like permease family protein [Phycicoccus avicenniae]|uniref:FtsX-like permease family protein n=1 Tax=Phycicoccus avicenniae TaxID=2828860 RepID=UPI003D26DC58